MSMADRMTAHCASMRMVADHLGDEDLKRRLEKES